MKLFLNFFDLLFKKSFFWCELEVCPRPRGYQSLMFGVTSINLNHFRSFESIDIQRLVSFSIELGKGIAIHVYKLRIARDSVVAWPWCVGVSRDWRSSSLSKS